MAPSTRSGSRGRGVVGIVVEQDSVGGAVQVVELARPQRPQKGPQPEDSEKEGDGNEKEEIVQRSLPRDSRKALTITAIDDVDMATAAISGVTCPETASGIVTTL